MYDALITLDSVRLNFSSENQIFINFTLAFIMFGVALGIRLRNFKRIVQNPKSVILGIISQFILLPFITFVFVYALKVYITPTIAMGMILVAACPGGNISNFITSISKGNIELSVSLTAFATISSVLLTPFNFSFWGNLYSKASHLVRPIEIPIFQVFTTIIILLGIPLVLGMLVAWKFPKLTQKIIKPIRIVSIIIFFAFVFFAFAANFSLFLKYIKYIFIIVLVHNALAILTGYSWATIFKVHKRDRRTISIETGIQNSGLALVLIFNPKIFPLDVLNGGMAFIAAWWGIWHIVSGLSLASFWSIKRFNRFTEIQKQRDNSN